jgi:hypothetical protein
MTFKTQEIVSEHAEASEVAERAPSAVWIRPEIRRLAAGSAEDGVGTTPDGVTPS